MTVDSKGNIFVADYSNLLIRKITPEGMVSTFAGQKGGGALLDGVGTEAIFYYPYGITKDKNDNLYVADSVNNAIRKITPDGTVTTIGGYTWEYEPKPIGVVDGPVSTAKFWNPRGIAIDNNDNLFVADYYGCTIRKITPDGIVSTIAGKPGSGGSTDGLGESARFTSPLGIAVDQSGNLYVADYDNHTIRKIISTSSGWEVTTFAGKAGSPGYANGIGASARFEHPWDITIDDNGNLFVVDNTPIVRKITPDGTVIPIIGTKAYSAYPIDGSGSEARFGGLFSIAIDKNGNLYVIDGHTIRKITFNN